MAEKSCSEVLTFRSEERGSVNLNSRNYRGRPGLCKKELDTL